MSLIEKHVTLSLSLYTHTHTHTHTCIYTQYTPLYPGDYQWPTAVEKSASRTLWQQLTHNPATTQTDQSLQDTHTHTHTDRER